MTNEKLIPSEYMINVFSEDFENFSLELKKILEKACVCVSLYGGYNKNLDIYAFWTIKFMYDKLNRPGKFETFFSIKEIVFSIRKREEMFKDLLAIHALDVHQIASTISECFMYEFENRKII